jgi:hypothetical protein
MVLMAARWIMASETAGLASPIGHGLGPLGLEWPGYADAEQNTAIASYVPWRNSRAQPKVHFAVGSPIRTWTDYPVKAA